MAITLSLYIVAIYVCLGNQIDTTSVLFVVDNDLLSCYYLRKTNKLEIGEKKRKNNNIITTLWFRIYIVLKVRKLLLKGFEWINFLKNSKTSRSRIEWIRIERLFSLPFLLYSPLLYLSWQKCWSLSRFWEINPMIFRKTTIVGLSLSYPFL